MSTKRISPLAILYLGMVIRMQLRNIDKMQRVIQIIRGLRDILLYMECCTVKDISVTTFIVFESTLEDTLNILCEIEEEEKRSGIDEKNGIND